MATKHGKLSCIRPHLFNLSITLFIAVTCIFLYFRVGTLFLPEVLPASVCLVSPPHSLLSHTQSSSHIYQPPLNHPLHPPIHNHHALPYGSLYVLYLLAGFLMKTPTLPVLHDVIGVVIKEYRA